MLIMKILVAKNYSKIAQSGNAVCTGYFFLLFTNRIQLLENSPVCKIQVSKVGRTSFDTELQMKCVCLDLVPKSLTVGFSIFN